MVIFIGPLKDIVFSLNNILKKEDIVVKTDVDTVLMVIIKRLIPKNKFDTHNEKIQRPNT